MTPEQLQLFRSGMQKKKLAALRWNSEPVGDIPMGPGPSFVLSEEELDAITDCMLEEVLLMLPRFMKEEPIILFPVYWVQTQEESERKATSYKDLGGCYGWGKDD